MTEAKPWASVCLVENGHGQILTVSRRGSPDNLNLPGGKIDEGETALEAMTREVREETNIDVLTSDLVFTGYAVRNEEATACFRAKTYRGVAKSREDGIDVQWVKPDRLLSGRSTFRAYNERLFLKLGIVNPLILALDVPSKKEAWKLAASVGPYVGLFKVGLELFMAEGMALVEELGPSRVMLDLKLHDIPETVERAALLAVGRGVRYLTIHAQQRETLTRVAKATQGTGTIPLVVTVLTSMTGQDMVDVGLRGPISQEVENRASLAALCGIEGFVCSAAEVSKLRKAMPHAVLVVPGIRPAGADAGDQKRVGTPYQTMADGASHIVVGRPIRDADLQDVAAHEISRDAIVGGSTFEP